MYDTNQLIVLITLGLLIIGLFSDILKPSVVFLIGVMVLLVSKVLSPDKFLSGFANQQVITIVLLVLISAGLRKNFNISSIFDGLFIAAKSARSFLATMMVFVASVSAFINNTPMVAMMTPYVYDWGKRKNVPPSKLLIPLSYATMLGGMITVVGTSTNLVLQGFLEQNNVPLLSYKDFLYLGLLVTLVGIIFILFIGYHLLPGNKDKLELFKESAREYLVETKISEISELIGKTVSEAKLRNLKGVYLVDIVRSGKIISPVSPKEQLLVDDKLIFAGDTHKIVELVQSNNGLLLPKPNGDFIGNNLEITEVVIPVNSPLAGQMVKDSNFRNYYDAAIVAIHRNGERLRGKIGEIKLQVGDLLLLTTGNDFYKRNDALKGLYVISQIQKSEPDNYVNGRIFLGIMGVVILLILTGFLTLFMGLLILFASLVVLKLFGVNDIRKEMDFNLIAILVCALAIGNAMIETGAAKLVADLLMSFITPFGNIGLLTGLFFLTVLLTTFITNAAAVSIVFPIAYSLCSEMNLNGTPYYIAIAFAASAAFMTPIGYQTNLMVYGPGGYKFGDYFKIGLPLTLIYSAVCLIFIILRYNVI
ncbi:SLC13 family permease [Chondrinema litorale]|uniref:SLC13 family permease n=1 Tax=Chondrinema litorale TaxID=2994555 RepID=UPI002543981C|nr:SLC13 family permease [Chondrinema litorale]UZS00165.1 SLC13 family permease [Chondrinema litorale]